MYDVLVSVLELWKFRFRGAEFLGILLCSFTLISSDVCKLGGMSYVCSRLCSNSLVASQKLCKVLHCIRLAVQRNMNPSSQHPPPPTKPCDWVLKFDSLLWTFLLCETHFSKYPSQKFPTMEACIAGWEIEKLTFLVCLASWEIEKLTYSLVCLAGWEIEKLTFLVCLASWEIEKLTYSLVCLASWEIEKLTYSLVCLAGWEIEKLTYSLVCLAGWKIEKLTYNLVCLAGWEIEKLAYLGRFTSCPIACWCAYSWDIGLACWCANWLGDWPGLLVCLAGWEIEKLNILWAYSWEIVKLTYSLLVCLAGWNIDWCAYSWEIWLNIGWCAYSWEIEKWQKLQIEKLEKLLFCFGAEKETTFNEGLPLPYFQIFHFLP